MSFQVDPVRGAALAARRFQWLLKEQGAQSLGGAIPAAGERAGSYQGCADESLAQIFRNAGLWGSSPQVLIQ